MLQFRGEYVADSRSNVITGLTSTSALAMCHSAMSQASDPGNIAELKIVLDKRISQGRRRYALFNHTHPGQALLFRNP